MPRQTVAEWLAAGGRVTVCPPLVETVRPIGLGPGFAPHTPPWVKSQRNSFEIPRRSRRRARKS